MGVREHAGRKCRQASGDRGTGTTRSGHGLPRFPTGLNALQRDVGLDLLHLQLLAQQRHPRVHIMPPDLFTHPRKLGFNMVQ